MNSSKIMLINGLLFILIVAIAVMVLTEERQLPGEPPVAELRREVALQLSNETSVEGGGSSEQFQELGKKAMFETIMPRPTPPPTPPPPTPTPPTAREVAEYWRLVGALTNFAAFQDVKTREDFTLKVGEHKVEKYKGKDVKVTLESLDRLKSATISIKVDGHESKHTFQMGF